jgi:3-phenylpropionate/trans-cinnamate dioxygenase ferredoxin reductase subunit
VFVHPDRWYADHGVDLVLDSRAVAIDRSRRRVRLAGGAEHRYDKLLIATGSTPRRLTVDGAELSGVHCLRTLDDSERLRDAFAAADHAVIIGAGWIGLETAAAARQAGLDVTVLEAAELPLLRALGPEAARMFADLHRRHGVDLRFGVQVHDLLGRADRVEAVRLTGGTMIETDLVLVGVGITPDVGLAAAAGLEISDGIRVDAHLQTSDPDIYAAGDVASAFHPRLGEHLRVEHWANAERQGALAARTMLGRQVVDPRSPYFFSDQYDLGMEYTGHPGAAGYDRTIIRTYDDAEQIVFWLRQGRVVAGMNVNVWDVAEDIDRLISSGAVVDVRALADAEVPLGDLVPAPDPARQPA